MFPALIQAFQVAVQSNSTSAVAEPTFSSFLFKVFFPNIWNRLIHLVSAPSQAPEMMWIVTPLLVTFLLMTFYFGKYTEEELGWNTAVGNSLVLVFVAIDLLRHIYNNFGGTEIGISNYTLFPIHTIIAFIIAAEGFFLLFSNFLHFLPKKIAFFISSPLPINLQAYVAIALVYTKVVFDRYVFLAAIVLFFLLLGFVKLLQKGERKLIGEYRVAKEKEKVEEEVEHEALEKVKKLEEGLESKKISGSEIKSKVKKEIAKEAEKIVKKVKDSDKKADQ